ncbi:Arc family DNA-binding protein [Pseudomonas nicosulfuronedens]|uniref:Arc family DNA-binding protein n=1 Tax=Pseudomonas nicosulfuronedens TaxID=2571105 RepID=UPI00244D3E31|nr:Arc family DNA-binding protein [Pseudomonas nicosulfuronedens]MDH1009963.1 Arc family DNA-binding protein [Pseudomonas nicosulfuronedens]MDH1978939.1 Arc family DNA-binding protein [Pseudomonas nicosulfuronedens]MDH2028382.1 Arc family DNA-binding protein [Pseudomonas nicosulfuronedens]
MPHKGSSRTADKFVVRLPDGVRDQVAEKCQASHISMNSYVVQALEEKLARDGGEPDLLSHFNQRLAAIEQRLDERAGLLS